jgi:hypothetical protein
LDLQELLTAEANIMGIRTNPNELTIARQRRMTTLGVIVVAGLSSCGAPNHEVQLPNTQAMVMKLKQVNGTLSDAAYQAHLVEFVNAFNRDISEQFGVAGLMQFSKFEELRLSEALTVATERGIRLGLYTTKDQKTGLSSIDVSVKIFGQQRLNYDLAAVHSMPAGIEIPTKTEIYKLSTKFATSGDYDPVGSVVMYRGAACLVIDDEQIRRNAKTAGTDPEEAVREVVLNEMGHLMLMNYLGIKPDDQTTHNREVVLVNGSKVPLLQVEEAFSDFVTFSNGNGSIAYHLLGLPYRRGVASYALTNELFTKGIKEAIKAHADTIAAQGVTVANDLQGFAYHLEKNPRLSLLQRSFRDSLVRTYSEFFKSNMPRLEGLRRR